MRTGEDRDTKACLQRRMFEHDILQKMSAARQHKHIVYLYLYWTQQTTYLGTTCNQTAAYTTTIVMEEENNITESKVISQSQYAQGKSALLLFSVHIKKA